jgi:DNA-binding GntR family transcriptional regulator
MMATKTTKTDRAYRKLKEHLEIGTFNRGERLTEAMVSRVIGLGRGPVRESMLRLEAEGHLRSKGAFGGMYVEYVESYSRDELIARYELREVVDGMAARLSALNMSGRQISELKNLDAAVHDELRLGNRDGRGEASRKFHDFLLKNCGNPLLERAAKMFDLHPVVARHQELDDKLLTAVSSMCDDSSTWYTPAVDAIARHDPDKAELHMRAWISNFIEALRNSE